VVLLLLMVKMPMITSYFVVNVVGTRDAWITSVGRNGLTKELEMKRYKIVYKDYDPGCPDLSLIVRAYNEEHAIDKFYADDDDWQIISIKEQEDV
jgi:hypothetical protein